MKAPPPFYERPDVLPWAQFYWTALNDLGSERSYGMGVGPIPRSKALAYASEHGIDDPDEWGNFWSIIARLDNEVIKLSQPKTQTEIPEEEPTGGRKRLPAPSPQPRHRRPHKVLKP